MKHKAFYFVFLANLVICIPLVVKPSHAENQSKSKPTTDDENNRYVQLESPRQRYEAETERSLVKHSTASEEQNLTGSEENFHFTESNVKGFGKPISIETSSDDIHYQDPSHALKTDTKTTSSEQTIKASLESKPSTVASNPTKTPASFKQKLAEKVFPRFQHKVTTPPSIQDENIQSTLKNTRKDQKLFPKTNSIKTGITQKAASEKALKANAHTNLTYALHTTNVSSKNANKSKTVQFDLILSKSPTINLTKIASNTTNFLQEIKRELKELVRWKSQHKELITSIHNAFMDDKKENVVLQFLGNRRKRSSIDDGNGFSEEIMRMIEDNFPCRHPETMALIESGTTYFNQQQCLECTCYMGKLTCKKNLKKCYPNACHLQDREVVQNLAIHNDGCNNCLCHFGQLICTHLRCPEAGHHYTNYKSMGLENVEPENNLNQPAGSDLPTRKRDSCLECDHLTGSPVCGRKQWKTFPTFCHAMFCGKNTDEDIGDRDCELLDPCVPFPCNEEEECVPFFQSACIANKHTSSCQQFKCISKNKNCSNEDMTDVICGVDNQSYESECEMFKKGVKLAYKGPCKKRCESEVCGIESRTFASHCHANEMNIHVDYNGRCEYHFKSALIKDNEKGSSFEDERCEMVYENGRCLPVKCEATVLPVGSCCPVCGSALVISINLRTSPDSTYRLQQVYTYLTERKTEIPAHLCKISVDLTYSMDILVVIRPYKSGHLDHCKDLAIEISDGINFARNKEELGLLSIFGAATMIKEKPTERINNSNI